MYEEFPHEALLKSEQTVSNGSRGTTKAWLPVNEDSHIECFVDTPSTDRIISASKNGVTVHRDLFCEYEVGKSIKPNWRVEYEGQDYTISGDMEDQGGMHEVMRIPLKKVT